MGPGKLRILIADDHSVLRGGVVKALSISFPNAEFGEAGNASEVLSLLRKHPWNLVILDISMPGRDGLEVLKDIKQLYPSIPVIIFSMYSEDQYAVRALRAGAATYLTKEIHALEFAEAIRKILRGERYLTPSLMEILTREIMEDHKTISHETLSDREYQVLMFIASGLNVSAIAEKLGLSVKTISVYRSNILKKMQMKNNSEITHYAFKHNLVK